MLQGGEIFFGGDYFAGMKSAPILGIASEERDIIQL